MRLQPLQDYILVRLLPEPARSTVLVVLSSPSRAQPAEVVAVGPEVRDVKPGEKVLVSKLAGQEVGDRVILREESVLAWL